MLRAGVAYVARSEMSAISPIAT